MKNIAEIPLPSEGIEHDESCGRKSRNVSDQSSCLWFAFFLQMLVFWKTQSLRDLTFNQKRQGQVPIQRHQSLVKRCQLFVFENTIWEHQKWCTQLLTNLPYFGIVQKSRDPPNPSPLAFADRSKLAVFCFNCRVIKDPDF